jgi:hypothetical protein
MTTIQLDNSNLAIAYDRANESFYILVDGKPVARFNDYAKANAFAWTLVPGAV